MFLRVDGLAAGYAGGGNVIRQVSFELDRGRSLGVLGRNGVGKSTLIMTLMGLLPTAGGIVELDGKRLTGRRPDQIARAGVALVPQGRRVWPPLTVAEHLGLAARRGGPLWTVERVLDLLPRLRERWKQPAARLSGGEQQMLAIARALLTNPALVLLDEPSEGLAPSIVDQVASVLATMRAEGVSVLLVEQDLHLAFAVCDEITVMDKGTLVHRASTEEFRRDQATAHRLLGVTAGD